jgi:hypothetical protein
MDYISNIKIVLTMQQMGWGLAGAGILGGMLYIVPSALDSQWTPMEE